MRSPKALLLWGIFLYFFQSRIRFRRVKSMVPVTVAAIMSLTGSATNTANTLLEKKSGRIKISGIRSTSLRSHAMSRLIFAWPSAIKVCWQAICTPVEKIPAI